MTQSFNFFNYLRALTKPGLGLCAWLGAGLLMSAVAVAQQAETSVECDEGIIAEPIAMVYGDSTDGCAISPAPSESDRFFFSGDAGDTVRLRLVTLTNDLDPVVDVRDSQNMSISVFSCTANSISRCSTGATFDLPESGDFLVIVSESGANNTGGYILDLEQILPPPTSVQVDYNVPLSDSISPTTDTDFFRFEATAGTLLRLNALTLSNDVDLRAQVYDPNGVLILNGIGDGAGCNANSISRCSFSVGFDAAETGTYSVQLYDDDAFNGGGYQFSVWCVFGNCDAAPTPDPDGQVLDYVLSTDNTIAANAGVNFYSFNAAEDTSIILRGVTLSNDLDPRVEVRDPNGDLVVSGVAAGAGCDANSISRCAFGFRLQPALPGTYSVLVADNDSFNTGGYRLSLFCVLGDCDSDGDGFFDGDREVLSYGVSITDNTMETTSDGDFYQFMGTNGDEIRLTVTGQSNDFDPTVMIHDPSGTLVVNGIGDGGGCQSNSISTCSFSKTLFPTETGVYSLALYDDDAFSGGAYDITLECIFGTGPGFTCSDLELPPVLCADNCSVVGNIPQRDTDADGYGNFCDPDLDNDGDVNFLDLGALKSVFFTTDPDGDFNGDGSVNFLDLAIMKALFFGPAGPSCAYPNSP